ncbi:uncharacterized protein HMPREF1541_10638 [Cyphellophora europaea CBS 101466]|uniref:ferric-chelate reductase (NADPH) n=1 Tax=Cyphellophora europaea (strain CBS 101466) TaxID=1220924 RepID=W2S707_CYPE1|nr:uncharacterized protein HMPREF1541_10638 [Cyphellophora europaea CBS 101466]ETN44457.1 hypothetical protein HMPREF1541_10638 [Cyphellophora europaea CBS 101466]
MDLNYIYAIVVGSVFFSFMILAGMPHAVRIIRYVSSVMSKHMVHRYTLQRHRLAGPWSRAGIVLQTTYIATNLTCIVVRVSSAKPHISTLPRAGLRAGQLCIVNLIVVFVASHLSLLADLLGVNLGTVRQVHRSAAVMAVVLALFHTTVAIALRASFDLDLPENLFAVIGASSLGFVALLSIRICRRPSYECFLWTHRALSVLTIFSVWRHLPLDKTYPRYCLYIVVGLYLLLCTVQAGIIIRRTGIFQSGHARAHVTHAHGAIRIRIQCQKPLEIKAGQYINLWMPSVSFWSFLQAHPFVVISWAEQPQDYLELFIEPRRGLTRELLYHAQHGRAEHSPVLFSGPHGKSVCIDGYGSVLMIASDFGIAAQLPYLKRLIHGYNARQLEARRVHLVWQIQDLDVTIAAQALLNEALTEDTLDNGWILAISIYCQSNTVHAKSFGKRANLYSGKAPLQDILQFELAGRHSVKKPIQSGDWLPQRFVDAGPEIEIERSSEILVTVSAVNDTRDELRYLMKDFLGNGVHLSELDYQPPPH